MKHKCPKCASLKNWHEKISNHTDPKNTWAILCNRCDYVFRYGEDED